MRGVSVTSVKTLAPGEDTVGYPHGAVRGVRGRRSPEHMHVIPVHLIGGLSQHDIAAILVADDHTLWCWYNRRLVHGMTLGLVELWAIRAVATGWYTAILSADDVRGLT